MVGSGVWFRKSFLRVLIEGGMGLELPIEYHERIDFWRGWGRPWEDVDLCQTEAIATTPFIKRFIVCPHLVRSIELLQYFTV